MRNPMKTMWTKSVQEKLDLINEALYAETNDLTIHVELIAGADYVDIVKICYNAILDSFRCRTSSSLNSTLYSLLYESRFPTDATRWWLPENLLSKW